MLRNALGLAGFTAGNVQLDQPVNGTTDIGEQRSIPVLVYAWAGGIIDVYSCGLIPQTYPLEESKDEVPPKTAQEDALASPLENPEEGPKEEDPIGAILQELVGNGSVQLFWEILENGVANEAGLPDKDSAIESMRIEQDAWELACKEFRSFTESSQGTQVPTFDQLLSDPLLEHIRAMLLAFASTTPQLLDE